jgi:integrase/recombinase XerC
MDLLCQTSCRTQRIAFAWYRRRRWGESLTKGEIQSILFLVNLSMIKRSTPGKEPLHAVTVEAAVGAFLETVGLARSKNTHQTYSFAMLAFQGLLATRGITSNSPISLLSEDAISQFADYLKHQSPATEQLYLQAAKSFYKFLVAEKLADINLPRLDLLRQRHARRPGVRLPQFPGADIERLLDYSQGADFVPRAPQAEYLRALRDRALLLTLADTGLRIHEACTLRRGEIDWNEGRAVIIGKGNRQAVVRISTRALGALKAYLSARSALDGSSGKALAALPLFSRHDKGAGKLIKPITTATGRNIVDERARRALGDVSSQSITPHSFRHYFVTTVLRASGNLKLAQELARHASIQVTQRYAHLSNDELDKGYYEIFERKH